MNEETVKILKLMNGEMIIAKLCDISADAENYFVEFPAMFVPMPQQQAIQFGKWLPFSPYDKPFKIAIHTVITMTEPNKDIASGYLEWMKKVRAAESGIIIPQGAQLPREAIGGQ